MSTFDHDQKKVVDSLHNFTPASILNVWMFFFCPLREPLHGKRKAHIQDDWCVRHYNFHILINVIVMAFLSWKVAMGPSESESLHNLLSTGIMTCMVPSFLHLYCCWSSKWTKAFWRWDYGKKNTLWLFASRFCAECSCCEMKYNQECVVCIVLYKNETEL